MAISEASLVQADFAQRLSDDEPGSGWKAEPTNKPRFPPGQRIPYNQQPLETLAGAAEYHLMEPLNNKNPGADLPELLNRPPFLDKIDDDGCSLAETVLVKSAESPETASLAEMGSLVERCQAGHPSALREFIARFEGPIFGLCYRMLTHRQDAEDMAQETFVRAVRHLNQWDRGREILPWLLAIAGNRCRSFLATRKRRPVNTELFEVAAADSQYDSAAELLHEELQRALARLRPEYAQAFMLFHERELPYDEISQLLDVPLGTIKTWIHRARKELVQSLRAREVLQPELAK